MNDHLLRHASGIEGVLERVEARLIAEEGTDTAVVLMGDMIYPKNITTSRCLQYKALGVTKRDGTLMSLNDQHLALKAIRASVEHWFGVLSKDWARVDEPARLARIQYTAPHITYAVAVTLTNIRCALNCRNEISVAFGCDPLTVDALFSFVASNANNPRALSEIRQTGDLNLPAEGLREDAHGSTDGGESDSGTDDSGGSSGELDRF